MRYYRLFILCLFFFCHHGMQAEPPERSAPLSVNSQKFQDFIEENIKVLLEKMKINVKRKFSENENHLVVMTQNPTEKVRIVWHHERKFEFLDRYRKDKTNHVVHLSRSSHAYSNNLENYEIKVKGVNTESKRKCGETFNIISAAVDQLEPNQTYYYVIQSGKLIGEEFYFVTPPQKSDVPFKLFSGGDSRTDRLQRIKMNLKLRKLFSWDNRYKALVHGGDYIQWGFSCKQWKSWLKDHQYTTREDNRVLPIVPTIGNHEANGKDLYAKIFGDPTGKEKFYYTSVMGPLSLIILDSETSVEGTQRHFLKSALNKAVIESAFIVAGYHRPAWPAVKDPASTASFAPLFEESKVDLVLESDGHALKQTCPIRDKRCVSGGVIYVGEGGLGVRQRKPRNTHKWYLNQMGGYAMAKHHIQSLEFSQDAHGGLNFTYRVLFDDKFQKPLSFSPKVRQ